MGWCPPSKDPGRSTSAAEKLVIDEALAEQGPTIIRVALSLSVTANPNSTVLCLVEEFKRRASEVLNAPRCRIIRNGSVLDDNELLSNIDAGNGEIWQVEGDNDVESTFEYHEGGLRKQVRLRHRRLARCRDIQPELASGLEKAQGAVPLALSRGFDLIADDEFLRLEVFGNSLFRIPKENVYTVHELPNQGIDFEMRLKYVSTIEKDLKKTLLLVRKGATVGDIRKRAAAFLPCAPNAAAIYQESESTGNDGSQRENEKSGGEIDNIQRQNTGASGNRVLVELPNQAHVLHHPGIFSRDGILFAEEEPSRKLKVNITSDNSRDITEMIVETHKFSIRDDLIKDIAKKMSCDPTALTLYRDESRKKLLPEKKFLYACKLEGTIYGVLGKKKCEEPQGPDAENVPAILKQDTSPPERKRRGKDTVESDSRATPCKRMARNDDLTMKWQDTTLPAEHCEEPADAVNTGDETEYTGERVQPEDDAPNRATGAFLPVSTDQRPEVQPTPGSHRDVEAPTPTSHEPLAPAVRPPLQVTPHLPAPPQNLPGNMHFIPVLPSGPGLPPLQGLHGEDTRTTVYTRTYTEQFTVQRRPSVPEQQQQEPDLQALQALGSRCVEVTESASSPMTAAPRGPDALDRAIDRIARKIEMNDWSRLSSSLGLTLKDLDDIKQERSGDTFAQIRTGLSRWRQKEGKRATVSKLKECLRENDRTDLADELNEEA